MILNTKHYSNVHLAVYKTIFFRKTNNKLKNNFYAKWNANWSTMT